LSLAVVFLAGLVIGVATTLLVLRGRLLGRLDPALAAQRDASRLRKSLQLDEQQAQQVEAILRARQSAVLGVLRTELDRAEQEVDAVLNEEQSAKWRQTLAWIRQRWLGDHSGSGRHESRADP
jgi:hypothetical protein